MISTVVAYEPSSAPMRGIRSKFTSVLNQPGTGYLQDGHNIRWGDDGVITSRLGVPTALSSAIGASGVFRGLFSPVRFNSVGGVVFATTKDSSNLTHIFKSSDGGVNWTEITASTGKYGDTRMSADGSGNDYETCFTIVHDEHSHPPTDCVIFQNGVDSPRVYDGTSLSKNEEIAQPDNLGSMRTVMGFVEPVPLGNPAALSSVTSSAASMVITDGGLANPNDDRILTINGAVSGDNAAMNIAASRNWQGAAQIQIFVEGTDDVIQHFIQGIKISVTDTSAVTKSLYEPYDAAVPTSEAFTKPVQSPVSGVSSQIMLSYAVPSDWIANAASKVTFTWNLAIGSGTSTAIRIIGMCGSNYNTGACPGEVEHSITWMHSASRSESPEHVLPIVLQDLQSLGIKLLTSDGTSTKGAVVPSNSGVRYTATVWYRNTTAALRDKGVDTLRIYRKEVGEDVFLFSQAVPLATYAGSWSFSSGSASSLIKTTDGTVPDTRDSSLPSPGGNVEPIPIGRAMVGANTRLMVGARSVDKQGTSVDAYPRVCQSVAGFPWRFAEESSPDDPNSAAEDKLPDGEGVQAFVAAPGETNGSSSVLVVSDRSLFSVNTHVPGSSLFLTRVLSIGTGSPMSVTEHMGVIRWVDPDMRVREWPGGNWISGDIDDKLQGIPSAARGKVYGLRHNDRYYLPYRPAGASINSHIVVYSNGPATLRDGARGAWESDDILPGISADFMARVALDSGTYGSVSAPYLLIANSADRKVYKYESGTTDLGSSVATTITFGDLHNQLWKSLVIKSWAIMAQAANATLTGVPTYKPKAPAGITGGSLSLNVSTPYQWGVSDQFAAGASDEGSGDAAQLSITGNLPGGKQILAIAMNVEWGSGTAERS